MKTYWDSSALVKTLKSPAHRDRLTKGEHWTRPHALAECFSALTGGTLGFKVDADDATEWLNELAEELQFVELTAADTQVALRLARAKGVQGGRVHDLMHVAAAEKCGAVRILTRDRNDFVGLTHLELERLPV